MRPPDLSRLLAAQGDNDSHAAFMAMHAERFDAYRTRHEDGTAPRAVSAFQLFQTPADVAARMVELADVRPGAWVLEPSAGLGRIIDPLLSAGANVVAVESSPEIAGELYAKYEGDTVALYQRDFLTFEHPRQFDRIVMNPPFHMRSDIKHILYACQFLKADSVLVALCMDTPHRHKALRHLSDTWEALPAGTFRTEGTDVATVILTIKK